MKRAKISDMVVGVILVICLCSFSSAEASQWVKTYAGSFNSIQQTSDGGFIAAGSISSEGAGGEDFWVVKLNPHGSIAWQKAYGGPGSDKATSIIHAPDGGYIVVGYTNSFGNYGAWVLKLNPDGSVVSQKTYGAPEGYIVNSAALTLDTGLVMAGMSVSNSWVFKLSPTGSIDWQKTYGLHRIDSIQQTADGGYIAGGTHVSPDESLNPTWLFKLNADGTVLWAKNYGISSPISIQQTPDGGYVTAGVVGVRTVVLRLDAAGDPVWQKFYSLGSWPRFVQPTSDGGYILAGEKFTFVDSVAGWISWMLKLNTDGTVAWLTSVEGSDTGFKTVHETGDGYITAGGSLISKVDRNGRIPNCGIVNVSNDLTIEDFSFAIQVTLKGTDTNIVPQVTAITALDTHTQESSLCFFSLPWSGQASFPIVLTSVADDLSGKFRKTTESLSGSIKIYLEEGNVFPGEGGCRASFLSDGGGTNMCFNSASAISTDVLKGKEDQLLLVGTGDFSMTREGSPHSGIVYLDAKGTLKKDISGEIGSIRLKAKIAGGVQDNFFFSGNFETTLTKEPSGLE